MDELISRQKVIDKLDEALEGITKDVSKESDAYHIVYGTVDVTKCMIMTIQPEPHWIPVTERLPEVKQKVLVQYADESMATKRCNDAGHLAWFYSNAVAWMPAPEPYKGGQND